MFKSPKVVAAYKNLIGWRQFNNSEIVLPADLTETETGEYFQQKHPALQLDVIKSTLNEDKELAQYLREVVTDSTNEIFNDLIQYRQLNEMGKTLLSQSVLLSRYGWKDDVIVNQSRFVGFKINVRDLTGLQCVINEIGLQITQPQDLKLYLFNSTKKEPIQEFEMTAGTNGFSWKVANLELSSFLSENYQGGDFYLGYYQDDLIGNAINYTNFDWNNGVCGGCNDPHLATWKQIRKDFIIFPIYLPSGSYTKGEMFETEKIMYSSRESFGLNLKLSSRCDLTDFFVQNKFAFKNLLAFKVVWRILGDMKFSQQINYIEENLKSMIIRDLEGDIETKLVNIPSLYYRELKAVKYNISGINSRCLPCEDSNTAPSFGVV